MMTTGRKDALGLPLLEMALLVLMAGIFAALLMRQMAYYNEVAEKTAVDLTLRQIRSALQLQMAKQLMQDYRQPPAVQPHSNPMRLVQPPENYRGEVDGVDPLNMQPGTWVFDRSTHTLLYRPRYTRYLKSARDTDLAYLKFVLESKQKSASRLENVYILKDLQLVSTLPYRWF